MKKLRSKKRVKVTIIIAAIAVIGFILAHFIMAKISNYEEYAKECSNEKGYACPYYEVRNYMIRGN